MTETELRRVKDAAEKLRAVADVVVVVGIGGSYLGARAVLEALGNPFACLRRERSGPDVVFAGQNISEDYLYDLLETLQGRSVGVIVISKSGTTTEPAIAFRILRGELEKTLRKGRGAREAHRRGDGPFQRSFERTGRPGGGMRPSLSRTMWGRYSVLTPVGCCRWLRRVSTSVHWSPGLGRWRRRRLPACRSEGTRRSSMRRHATCFTEPDREVEILGSYEPSLHYVGEWWKQLFGESEGKEGKGIFPASVTLDRRPALHGTIYSGGRENVVPRRSFRSLRRFTSCG